MINHQKIADLIRAVSDTEIMPRFRNLGGGDVREKGPGDFVTVADEAAEKALTSELTKLLPGSKVVGEEAVAKDPKVLDLLHGDTPVWIIDPIDGTYNFKEGRSRFGVLLALTQRGETLAGWSYDAPGDRMALAIRGQGATIDQGRKDTPKPLRLAPKPADTPFKDMTGYCGGKQAWHFKNVTKQFKKLVNERSSLHDFLAFATGQVDFILHTKTTPWDHSAGILLAEEAGGYVGINKDERFRPDKSGKDCILVAAGDQIIRQRIYEAVAPIFIKA